MNFLKVYILTLLACSCSKNEPIKVPSLDKKTEEIALPYYNEPDFTPNFISDKSEVASKIKHTIGGFSFLNQDSTLISQKAIEGKIHIANFIFTSCGSICPIMTTNLKIVNDSLKNHSDIIFLSYSVTPWIDTPTVLKKIQIKK